MLTWLLVSLFLLVSQDTLSQVKAIHFNADWNKQNTAEWFDKLGDCEKQSFMIDGNHSLL